MSIFHPWVAVTLCSIISSVQLVSIAAVFAADGIAAPVNAAANRADWLKANGPYAQGNSLAQLKQYGAAIEKYKEAIAIFPDEPNYHFNLALAYKHKGELSAALDEFKKCSELSPHDWKIWKGLANTYYKLGRFSEAQSAFEQALRSNPPSKELPELTKGKTISATHAK